MEKKTILLLYTNARIRNQKPRPPVGFLYLAAALREKYEPIILDLRVEKDYKRILKEHLAQCVFVGISTIIGQQLRFSLAAAQLIKGLAPDMPVVFGGTFPSMAPEVVLREKEIDFVSIGDGEDTLAALADCLSSGGDVSCIENLAYRCDGKVIVHKTRKLRRLDTPAVPAWDLVRPDDYRELNVLTSKGCSAGCTFCYNRVFNNSCLRLRPVDCVWQEITLLRERYGAKHIAFVDDNFFADRAHAIELMRRFRNSSWGLTWETTCRADDLISFDDEMMTLLRDSGCKELFVGFESASEAVLKRVNKHIKTGLPDTCIRKSSAYGIRIRALYVIGLVGESRKDLLRTLDEVDRLRKSYGKNVKIPVFGIYTPYPQLPPDLTTVGGTYREPQTMLEWSSYHHDRANHQWLSPAQRDYLENIIWIYRYVSKRSRFTGKGKAADRLLRIDAAFRWRLRFFRLAPEWRHVRQAEQRKYEDSVWQAVQEYQDVIREWNNERSPEAADYHGSIRMCTEGSAGKRR